ncbi:MAG: CPBP family intramembrane metalloprotease [Blastocatellia bacterium]|nr:CPBP family intramembrane metalloprotease [Blastocatellia bacterium]
MWNSSQRPFDSLGLGLPLHWRFWTGLGVVLLAIAGLILQLRRIQNSEEARNQVRDQLQPVAEILPHDRTEMTRFTALSLTAGISEEILYRGFLIWYISQFAGLLPAVLLSSVLFGLGHIYQGLQGVIKTAAIGLFSALLYILTESLWVPMLLHAYVDINSGQMAYLVLRSEESASATV